MSENIRITPVDDRLLVKVIGELGAVQKAEVLALSPNLESKVISVGSIVFIVKDGERFLVDNFCFIIEVYDVIAVVEELVENE